MQWIRSGRSGGGNGDPEVTFRVGHPPRRPPLPLALRVVAHPLTGALLGGLILLAGSVALALVVG